jgi:hypothetical protein
MSSVIGADIGFGTQGNNYIDPTGEVNIATPEPGTFRLLGASAMPIGPGSQRKRLAKG